MGLSIGFELIVISTNLNGELAVAVGDGLKWDEDDEDNIDKLMHMEIRIIITSNGLFTLVLLNNLNKPLKT